MEHGARRHRLLPMAGDTFIDPRPRLQPPRIAPATAGADEPARPAQLRQVLNAPLLAPKPRCKVQKTAHFDPPSDLGYATRTRSRLPEHYANLPYLDRETLTFAFIALPRECDDGPLWFGAAIDFVGRAITWPAWGQ